jgi:translation initiation factor IF-3
MTADEARERATEEGYDLVEVAPNSKPPVCRIMDYGKYKYEQKKKAAAGKAKGKGRAASMKEVKMRPSTDDHDLDFKLKNARRFLLDGDKVKVTVMFRGREMAHRRNGYAKLDQVEKMLGDLVSVEGAPQMSGRFLSMVMVPNREAVEAARKAEAAAEKAEKAEAAASEESAPAKPAEKKQASAAAPESEKSQEARAAEPAPETEAEAGEETPAGED